MFKCLNLYVTTLQKYYDIHNYNIRKNHNFIAPKCPMKKSEMPINAKSIKDWNKIR